MNMMENLCRLCGSEEGIKVDIFELGSERVKKIHKILPITVNEYDPFPKQICHHCSYKVNEFFAFRTTAIKTYETFKKKVPWLRGKKIQRHEGELPMVEVNLNSVNAVSPSEKEISQSNGSYGMSEECAIVIEDSPPYVEDTIETNTLVSGCEVSEQQSQMQITKHKKSKRSRSLWDTKKRKRKSSKSCRIVEVYTTSEQDYQNLANIENDPLRLSPVDNIENNGFENIVENNSCSLNSPRNEHTLVEKGILTDDRGGTNIALPKYILITQIPRVGDVYTCERCGRTFLKPQSASHHICPEIIAIHVEEDRPKEEPQRHQEDVETDTTKDFYQCSDCGHVFTRHSQLISHQKTHKSEVESSSDDSFKPFNKRRKHHTKTKHKSRRLNTKSSYNSNGTTTNNHNSTITKSSYNSNGTTTNDHNSTNMKSSYNSSNGTITNNHNSTSTITTHYNSNSTFEDPLPNVFLNFDAVDSNITRHALLSSDSE